jgi:hypothetical protein
MRNKKIIFSIICCIFFVIFASAWADNSGLAQSVDGCNILNTSNAIYTLTSNVTSTGECFTVAAENITIDCANYWINYSTDGGNNERGISINSFNTTIKNCNIVDGNWTFVSDGTREGIYLDSGADNCTLFNNSITTNTTTTIYVREGSDFNNLTSNIVVSGATGMVISGSYNTLIWNTGNTTLLIAWYMSGISIGGQYNTLINNTANSPGYALIVEGGDYNTFNNNTAISTESTGVLIQTAYNNTFINQISIGATDGIDITISGNNLFRDCGNISGVSDIKTTADEGSINNTFLNCSYDTEDISGVGNELIRKWYYQAYVNYSNGDDASDANITAYNASSILQFTAQTNNSGYIDRQEVTEYINREGTVTYFSNYTIFANKTIYENQSQIYNITIDQNQVNEFFTLGGLDLTPPAVVFSTQSPSDIDTLNILGTPLWINYTISADDLDNSTIYLYYKANSTVSDVQYYQNGTAHSGYFSQAYTSNTTTNFGWKLEDNSIYKGTYNFGEVSLENYSHTVNITTANPEYYKIEFLNISNTSTYGIFEIMANSSASANPLRIYYCNSSYSSGNVNGSSNCVMFNTLTGRTTFNHTHTAYSSHQVIPFAINYTTQTLNGIKVTEKSYFIIGGATNWQIWNIHNTSRTGAIAKSTNTGGAWTNQIFTIDSNIHQYNATDTFYYYVCANDTNNNENCTSIRSDLMQLAGLPPTAPSISSPTNKSYSSSISINYSEAQSPNSYNITYYNISLLNTDYTLNKTISTNNSINLNYTWDSSATNGQFILRVEATDNMSQNSTAYSEVFTVDNVHPAFTAIPSNSSLFYGNQSLLVNFTATDETEFGHYSVNDTRFSINSTGFLSNATLIGVGNYSINVTINDSANNINWTTYKVQVNKSEEFCQVLFSETSPVTDQETFYVWANCTSAFTLYRNVTEISNNSLQSLSASAYRFSFERTDTSNYSVTSHEAVFIVIATSTSTSSSSSSSSTPTSSKTYITDAGFSLGGNSFEMRALDKIIFEVNESNHTLTLNSFNSTTARVTIRSTLIIAYLSNDGLEEFDSNNDSLNDVKIKYTWINSSRAEIFLQAISLDSENPILENLSTEQGPQQENNTGDSTNIKENFLTKLSNLQKILLVVSLVLFLIAGYVIFYVVRKKIREKEQENLPEPEIQENLSVQES